MKKTTQFLIGIASVISMTSVVTFVGINAHSIQVAHSGSMPAGQLVADNLPDISLFNCKGQICIADPLLVSIDQSSPELPTDCNVYADPGGNGCLAESGQIPGADCYTMTTPRKPGHQHNCLALGERTSLESN